MSNRIEQTIGDFEEYIDSCKIQAFSSTKIIVERPKIDEFLDDLRHYIPEEVKKYQRFLNSRDKLLADAKKKASEVEDKAQAYAEHMVSENQITKLAYERAEEITNAANEEAKNILEQAENESRELRDGALSYTTEMLMNIQRILADSVSECQNGYSSLLNSLTEHQNIISDNLKEMEGMYSSIESEPSENTPLPEAEENEE